MEEIRNTIIQQELQEFDNTKHFYFEAFEKIGGQKLNQNLLSNRQSQIANKSHSFVQDQDEIPWFLKNIPFLFSDNTTNNNLDISVSYDQHILLQVLQNCSYNCTSQEFCTECVQTIKQLH